MCPPGHYQSTNDLMVAHGLGHIKDIYNYK